MQTGKPEAVTEPAAREEKESGAAQKRKAKESPLRTLLRIVLSLVVIAVGVYLVLFVISKAAHYDSIQSMLQHMWGEVAYMWANRSR